MGIFDRRQHDAEVGPLYAEHIEAVAQCLDTLVALFATYCSEGGDTAELSMSIHRLEHDADEVRRRIERRIQGGAILPLHRLEFLQLAEHVDKVANAAESVADSVTLERPELPAGIREPLQELARAVAHTFAPLREIHDLEAHSFDEILAIGRLVEDREQEADKIEWRLLEQVFGLDLDLAHKLQLRGLVRRLGKVANCVEDASDWLEIMVARRGV